jgi:4-amino-4-deoxy-L-arabinose transferase-like glycosyltransferase
MRSRSLRWFVLINVVLLLLFGWTLTEESTVTVRFDRGFCRGEVYGRLIATPCGDMEPAWFGFYTDSPTVIQTFDPGLLDWLAPRPAISWAEVLHGQNAVSWSSSFGRSSLAEWQFPSGRWVTRLGELRSGPGPAAAIHPLPLDGIVTISAGLRRPETDIGLLLLDPAAQSGRLFIVSAQDGWGTWWRWQDGHPTKPLVAVPFRRPALAESQSFLRRLLRAHQAALALLAIAWLFGRVRPGRFLPQDRSARVPWAVLALTLLTFLGTTLIANVVLERIPHVQDSLTYLFQAQTLARGRLSAPAPPAPDAFAQEFLLVRAGRWFGKYPPGFPILLAAGVLVGVPWLVNPFLAALTIPLLYALGRELYDRRVGLLAALLGATSPFFLFLSGSLMSHSAELFWIVLMMLAWARAIRSSRFRAYAVLAGVALGMAFLTRQMAAVAVGATFLGAGLFGRGHLRRQLPRLLLLGLAALPFFLLLLGYQWAITGDPLQDPRLLYWSFDRLGFGPDSGNNANLARYEGEGAVIAWYDDPDLPPAWHSLSRGIHNLADNLQQLEVYLYGWLPIASLVFVWLLFLLIRPARSDWLLFATIVGLVLAYIPYWAHGIMYGPRYYYAALPALVLLTARGFQALALRVGDRAGLAVLTLLITGNLVLNLPYQAYSHQGYNHVSRRQLDLVRETVQTPALVLVAAEEPGWWEYGALFSANTPWLDGPIVVARDIDPILDDELIDHFAGRHVYRLEGMSLHPLASPG